METIWFKSGQCCGLTGELPVVVCLGPGRGDCRAWTCSVTPYPTVKDEGSLWTKEDVYRIKQSLMYGEKGFDCLFAFSILVFPDWKEGPPTRKQHRNGMIKLMQWLWGWGHLENQTNGRFPNDDLWKQIKSDISSYQLL